MIELLLFGCTLVGFGFGYALGRDYGRQEERQKAAEARIRAAKKREKRALAREKRARNHALGSGPRGLH